MSRAAAVRPCSRDGERVCTASQCSGHANFSTTQRYVNLAGVVFTEEAAALERRMNGRSVEGSTDLTSPESTSANLTPRGEAEEQPTYSLSTNQLF